MIGFSVSAPSPQQTFSSQGVLRISGLVIKDRFKVYQLVNMYIYIIVILLQLCGDIELNPGPSRKPCRIMYSNIRGLYSNIKDLQVASKEYDVILCSETLVSDRRHISELLIPGFNKPTLLLRNSILRARGLAIYIRSGFSASVKSDSKCSCHEVQLVKICSKSNNFYIFSIYRNPDLDNSIYDCLLTSMSMIQESDRKSAFIFVGDFNAHHKEWLGSVSPTDMYGRAALDFSNLSGCDQLIVGSTHRSGNCLDLLFTDVRPVVHSSVQAPLGSSDHSVVSFKLTVDFELPNMMFSRKVYLKSRADWPGIIRDINNIKWSDIYNSNTRIGALNSSLLNIINCRIPTKVIKSRLKDKVWFNDDCRRAFHEKQTAYKLWSRNRSQFCWDNFVRIRSETQLVYASAELNYREHLQSTLASASQPHKWWSALKSFLFGVESALPPLRKEDGSVAFDPAVKAEILSEVFLSKQSNQRLDLPPTCFPSEDFCYFAFKSSEIKYLLNDLDSFGGIDPNGIFPFFLTKVADQLSPKIATIFRRLLMNGEFPSCWRFANITPIPKGTSPTQFSSDYRPISITPVLSKIYEKLLVKRLYKFVSKRNILPSTQFGFRKGLSTTDALLTLLHDLQSSLDCGSEIRVLSLDFSSAFDLVNHEALLYKLKLIGVGGPIFNVFKNFLTNRQQRTCVDGSFSSFNPVLSGVPQGSVLGPLFFILYTADMWYDLENQLIAYADDTTLYAPIVSPMNRSGVAESLNRDLIKIEAWCAIWGMRLNPNKSQSIIVSRSRTIDPPHPPLYLSGAQVLISDSIKLLGVTLDNKLTFETHIRQVSISIAQKTGLLRKCRRTLCDNEVIIKSFFAFILPFFEYCMPVWFSAADCHLKLLDRALNGIRFILPDFCFSLEKRRTVGCLVLLYKILENPNHPLYVKLPGPYIHRRITRYSLSMNDRAFSPVTCRTNQYSRSFIPKICKIWSELPNSIVNAPSLQAFKTAVNAFFPH